MAADNIHIIYYGTGLALSDTRLSNGIPVELRRDPKTRKWKAAMNGFHLGSHWEEAMKVFPSLHCDPSLSEEYVYLEDTTPQRAVKRLDDIVQSLEGTGWIQR